MESFSIAILTPKAPLTEYHKKIVGDEIRSALKSVKSLTLYIPVQGAAQVPSYIRSWARDPNHSVVCEAIHFDRHYKLEALVGVAKKADLIIG